MKRWCAGAKQDASLGAVRRVIQLFRTACHYGDPSQDDDDSSIRIASDSAFQYILAFTLTEADSFFRKLLSLEGGCAHLPASTFTTAKCVPPHTVCSACSLSQRRIDLPCDVGGLCIRAPSHLDPRLQCWGTVSLCNAFSSSALPLNVPPQLHQSTGSVRSTV
jgi:hypothetical protein